MKSHDKAAPLWLSASFVLMLVGHLTAQTFTTLHSFDTKLAANAGSLVLSNSTLFGSVNGMFSYAGSAIYKISTDGTGFTNLYTFDPLVSYTNLDGAFPAGEMVLSSNRLYGTTSMGGGFQNGTVFALNCDGTAFSVLHTFSALISPGAINDDGATAAGLTLLGNTLYGAAANAGNFGDGTVFKVNVDGTGFTTLYNFTGGNDGIGPVGDLILAGNTLYGTTGRGGSNGNGTVFAINIDGTGFTNLHTFSALGSPAYTNEDGAMPSSGLIVSGSRLYGTTIAGGAGDDGTVFTINADGTGFKTLHSFSARDSTTGTNSDGALPIGGLNLSGDTLYGTAATGGASNEGTVFALHTDGLGFTTLYNFTAAFGPLGYVTNIDGKSPQASLILSGNTLYGTAKAGGIWGYGTVFSLSFSPQLSIVSSASNIVLSWPTNYAGIDYSGYALQSTMNLDSPVWTTNLPAPVVVNGQNTVTNPISGTQQFFRLSQ